MSSFYHNTFLIHYQATCKTWKKLNTDCINLTQFDIRSLSCFHAQAFCAWLFYELGFKESSDQWFQAKFLSSSPLEIQSWNSLMLLDTPPWLQNSSPRTPFLPWNFSRCCAWYCHGHFLESPNTADKQACEKS